jgi:hypothetical protein
MRTFVTVMSAFCLLVACAPTLRAQPTRSLTKTFVKATVATGKPNIGGVQHVVVGLDIDKDYYLMARDLPEDLMRSQLKIDFHVGGKRVESSLNYPAGQKVEEKLLGDYTIYRGKVSISGIVQRPTDSDGPLEATISMQGYPLRQTY